jgi:large conductance mechanosensitive channel
MGFIKEFKEFALKGNVVDLAIAVIIGAAFGAIVSSLVDDVITPLLLTPALKAAHAEDLDQLTWGTVKYGKFLSSVIKFIVIAMVLFTIIQLMNRLKRKKDVKADVPSVPELTVTEKLLTEINSKLK